MEEGKMSWAYLRVHTPLWLYLLGKYIKHKARLDELQAGTKIARRNINNLRYADDTTLKWQKAKRN